MKVAIYSRFSTDTQDVTSIAGQVANCEALAARENLRIVARYEDEGISGNDDNRPGYQSMLADLKFGKFVGIVCDETSRITRNQAELHRLVAELNFKDQFLISGDGIDTRIESSELLLSIKAAVDAMEGRKIGYRTYRSLRERHKAGHCAGGRIYGYSTEQDGDYRKRVIDPEQAAIVAEIFELYAAGDSAKTIARVLNERGVPSPGSYWKNKRSIGWPHTTIIGSYAKASGILRNPIYKGTDTWNKRIGKKRPGTGKRVQSRRPESEWIQNQDESLRIVSDALWAKVDKRLYRARKTTNGENRRGRPPKYLLSGLLKCASCGSSYTVWNGRSYTCSSQTNGRDVFCKQKKYIFRSMVERKLLGGIKEQLLDPKVVAAMAKEINKLARKPKRDIKAEIKELDKKIGNTVDSLVSIGSSLALTTKLRELEARREELCVQKPVTTDLITGATEKWCEIASNLECLSDLAKPDEITTARRVIREIIGEIEVKETTDGVFAYTKLNAASGDKAGAQKRT